MIICKSWEQQVLDNTKAIKQLQEGGGSELAEQVSELNQQMARTLKLPMSGSADTRIVAVNDTGDQEMLSIGNGLSIEYGSLVASGADGSGTWTKKSIQLNDLAESFSLDVTDAEAPIIIGIENEAGYFSATMTNNAQSSSPKAYSTLFYAWGTVCCIASEDGICQIVDASTGQTPPNSGYGALVEYWFMG